MSKPPLSETANHYAIDISANADGKLSIEHQIEVFVHDLFDVKENKSISLKEVLEGLRYVMDFRIMGGLQVHLDLPLMRRLCKGILLNTGHTEGHLLRKRVTFEADLAFFLFGDFLEEVQEFGTAVSELDVFELRSQLKIHHRCQPSTSTPKQKRAAVALVHLLAAYPQFSDWRDLIKESEQSDLDQLLKSSLADEVRKSEKAKMPRPHASEMELLLPPPALYFDRSVEKLFRMFQQTDPKNGLDSTLIASLRENYGTNQLSDPPKPSALKMLWEQLTDFMVLILIAAAIVQAGEQEFNSMAVLLVVVVLNTVIGFSQEWKANKTLNALMNLSVPQARVIRDGETHMIDSAELVPGDLVVLEEGDAVPADLRLVEVSQLAIVESILTGESLPIDKSTDAIKAKTRRIPLGDCKGNALMSTTVARGRGVGIVVRTGEKTEIGKISTAIQAGSKRKNKTPIQRKLTKLGKYLVLLAIFLCALVVIVGVAWKRDVKEMINIGLSLAVSVIPEGLVAVTTVTMALGVRRMATNQCIVRTLPAVESLGSVTVICSDKTGTLTEGKMNTAELWTADNALYRYQSPANQKDSGNIVMEPSELRRRMIHVRRSTPCSPTPTINTATAETIIDYAAMRPYPVDTQNPNTYNPAFIMSLLILALCNNSDIRFDEESKTYKMAGDPTEVALTLAANMSGAGRSFWNELGLEKIFERAFDSERKRMSSIYKDVSTSTHYVLCKGAPEEVLEKCSAYLSPEQSLDRPSSSTASQSSILLDQMRGYAHLPVSDDFAAQVSDESTRMASQGLRVLGLAYRSVPSQSDVPPSDDPRLKESNLVFVGLVGMIDPPKQGVEESVATCQAAGIRVIMITGDHIRTATAIAETLGIFQKDTAGLNRSILGRELDLLSEDAIMELDPFPTVFARVSPDNKLSIVKALQARGEIVAMTGDGVNDAPAIKCADVGVAMGMAGTEITKQAADVILVNDNFTTIVTAVKEGRHVFDNILKFIVYLLSCNGAEIFLMLVCAIAKLETPLTVMMILWANIIADIPPAMSLGMEPKECDLMSRSPRDPSMGVLTKAAWIVIFLNSLWMASLTIASYVISLYYLHYPLDDAQSVAFACITMMQLLHCFNARSVHLSIFVTGIWANRWMIGAFFLSFGFLILGIYCPGISTWLELTFITWQSWIMVLLCCLLLFIFVEIEKWVIRTVGGTI